MALENLVSCLRSGVSPDFPATADTLAYAQELDSQDALRHLRDEFYLPTKASLKKRALNGSMPNAGPSSILPTPQQSHNPSPDASPINHPKSTIITNGFNNSKSSSKAEDNETGIYFVGNSLGAQPKAVQDHLSVYLETWASIGVNGHFVSLDNSPLTPWQHLAEECAKKMADIAGSSPGEIVVMNSLTVNLHLMLASFYKPSGKRHKIILEWKPFPSDYYVAESQITWHGLDPASSMILVEPDNGSLISTEKILCTIDQHVDETALILLPGIQYYSGQLFDISRITAHARARGITVGWDLAHAVGNVELYLHDWGVDFACWCTYKYLNAGPGAIAAAFVHERHGHVQWKGDDQDPRPAFHPRLTGWYGGDIRTRFNMDNKFVPTAGAGGFQVSNPSAVDLASLSAALSIFNKTNMRELRSKALALTAYTEYLLDRILAESKDEIPLFEIITPRDPAQRGTQLSVLLRDGLLDNVMVALENNGVLCDKRKPNVIRIAPVPLYSRFEDVWKFMQIFGASLNSDVQ
ncbi:hypothetical protein S40293_03638 [Stachybotrys chartarum IBT 40293]|nr:hypothetical protein S40293_03638 [Stachybotrys chartarum IBT 40293]